MAALYTALCMLQTFLGLGPRKDESRSTTDWLKLALAVAARPEDEESKRLIHVALESDNQEFLGLLRAALDTRVAAAARLADIENDGIECRALLPGSPALWGWTTNMAAETAILKAGIEFAMSASVFNSPSASCSNASEDVFVGLNSTEPMGGATLRDIYAKAWEFHREPLIWTPRGPGAGVGASTWTLTPASLVSQRTKTRNRSVSDASESRSSIAAQSPCLQAQRNRIRRDSLHDVFIAVDNKKGGKTSPPVQAKTTTLSSPPPSPLVTLPSPLVDSDPPVSGRSRRSTSCTRSHVSSTTAVTVSECSTTQELHGLGLGRSLDRSGWSRSSTPLDSWAAGCEPGKEAASKGKKVVQSQVVGVRGLISVAVSSRRNKPSGNSVLTHNSKYTKSTRPSITPLQRQKVSVPKRTNEPQHLTGASSGIKTHRDTGARTARFNSLVAGSQDAPARPQETSPIRRVRSVAAMTPSPSPYPSRGTNPKTPLVGPVPTSRRGSIQQDTAEPSRMARVSSRENTQDRQDLRQTAHSVSTPAARQTDTHRTPSDSRSRIPRPVSRAGSISVPTRAGSPAPSASSTPRREPQQLSTPTSTVRVRERTNSSQAPRPVSASVVGRARSRTGLSSQDRPALVKDVRLSRPPSRSHIIAGPSDVVKPRSRRSDSITSVPMVVDRWETPADDRGTRVAA